MCILCQETQTFDPDRHVESGPIGMALSETTDAAESTSTTYVMAVGDTFSGTLSSGTDEDWVRIRLVAGQTYTITLTGDTLSDPYLRIYNANGSTVLASNDDYSGLDSQITFTATYTGNVYLEADAYSTYTGTYDLAVQRVAVPSDGTLNEMARYLTHGYWGGSSDSFDTSSSNVITVNISGLTAAGRQLARWAMDAWEMVANVDFRIVSSGEMITFDDELSGAFAYTPNGGSSNGVEVNISRAWLNANGTTIDSYSYQTYLHEIGHALGLGHQGGYNGNATFPSDARFGNDSWQLSVMSYFSQTDNSTVSASYAYTLAPMMVDIIAIQNLYGAARVGTATSGNTIYGMNSNLGNHVDQFFTRLATGSATNMGSDDMTYTIYDRGGVDALRLGFLTENADIDLRATQFSDIGDNEGIIGIARGTVIENAFTGSGNDRVTGNSVGNRISTGSGRDTIDSGDGNDTVIGGLGRDRANLGDGADRFEDDAQTGDLGRDTVMGQNGNDTIVGGGGNDQFNGGAGRDSVMGGSGNDNILGGTGHDTLRGGAGRDEMLGGSGQDLARGGSGGDTIIGGTGNDTLYGENENDRLVGDAGTDRLIVSAEADTLVGGFGADTLTGGAGADRFVFSASQIASGADVVTDYNLGTDEIRMSGVNRSDVNISYHSGSNQVFVFVNGDDAIILRSSEDLSGFGLDDINFA